MRNRLLAIVLALAVCTGCNRGGLSHAFRGAANDALDQLRQVDGSESRQALDAADAAVVTARTKVKTKQDLRTADVLDWYDTLLHRSDRQRTRNWRAVCDGEAQMYLDGHSKGEAEVWSDLGLNKVPVRRGDCQAAFFQMLTEDCRREMGNNAANCDSLQISSIGYK